MRSGFVKGFKRAIAVRKAVACEDMSVPMFDDDWSDEISEYHNGK